MDASTDTGGAVMTTMIICPPRVSLASMLVFQTCHLPCICRGVELIKTRREYTHKYCLFLACLRAARVWSLLKSPESDSKMSSIRIPAFDLHKSLIIVLMHKVATKSGCPC